MTNRLNFILAFAIVAVCVIVYMNRYFDVVSLKETQTIIKLQNEQIRLKTKQDKDLCSNNNSSIGRKFNIEPEYKPKFY